MIYFLIVIIPILINIAVFIPIAKKEGMQSKLRIVLFHLLLVFMLSAVIGFSLFTFSHFFPVEIQYNFLRTVFVFAIVLLAVLTASFAYYCFGVKKDALRYSSFGQIWCFYSSKKEKSVKQEDRISRKDKMLNVLPSVLGISYMLFFFGISETFFANIQEWLFVYEDIVFPAVFFAIGVALSLLLIFIFLLKGKYYNRGIIVCTSVFAGLYLQNAFLNTEKFINGAKNTIPHWELLLNAIIWIALLVIPQIVYTKKEKFRKAIRNGAVFISGVLLLIQIVPIPYLLISFENRKPENYGQKIKKENVLSGDDQFTVSSEGNVIVFILDGYQNTNFEYHMKQNPSFKDNFKDFIYYDNVSTVEMNTVTSMPCLLTATDVDYSISLPESNKKSWNSDNAEKFYSKVKKEDYSVYLYSDSADYCGGADNMMGKISNVKQTEYEIVTDSLRTYFAMVKLSMYKYMPLSLKDFFVINGSDEINRFSKRVYEGNERVDSDDFAEMLYSAKDRGICMYNYDYYSGLKEGLKVEKGTKRIVFEHMFGMHEPYFGLYGEDEVSNYEEQEICCTIINEYTRQLKELGLYEESCIIITADHGVNKVGESDPIMLIKLPNYHGDEMKVNTAPGCIQSDLLPTVLDIIGVNPKEISGGYSLLDLPEDSERERELHYITYDSSIPPVPKCEGIGFSYVNCFEEYRFTGRSEEIDKNRNFVGLRPLFDYWW